MITVWTKIKDCLEDLKDFSLNKYSKKYETSISAGKPVKSRQQFLREQGLLQRTFDLLYMIDSKEIYSRIKNTLPLGKKDEDKHNSAKTLQKVENTLDEAFNFLNAISKSNSSNKKEIFSKKELFLYFFFEIKSNAACLIEIIKESETFLICLVDEKVNYWGRQGSFIDGIVEQMEIDF